MSIFIRIDDITADMDWSRFEQVKDILDCYDVKPLIGVVPANEDSNLIRGNVREDYWEYLKSLVDKGWKIALHGYSHVYLTQESGLLGINPFSEFAGVDWDTQRKKILDGKNELLSHGIATDVFMAPGHTFDSNTLRALRDCGFTTITDGLNRAPYIRENILFIPCRLRGYNVDEGGTDTICLHPNTISDEGLRILESFLSQHRNIIEEFDFDRIREKADVYSTSIAHYEKRAMRIRHFKDKIADSKRLAWYMSYTNHSNGKIKKLKRIVCLPLLLMYKEKSEH